jgi:hypothetical protein
MTFPNTISNSDILFMVASLLWMVWPLVLVMPMEARHHILPMMIVMWFILLAVRLAVALDPKPFLAFIFIKDPLSTLSFLGLGPVLFVVAAARGNLRFRPH